MNIPNDYEIRIQGESIDIFKSREFRPFTIYMEKRLLEPLPDDFLTIFEEHKKIVLKKYTKWYPFYLDILHALHYEFDKIKEYNVTYQDLYDFIQAFTQKDDGQLYQLYERTKEVLSFKNIKSIILTTIHRVKGLEYDTVIVLPSYASLPFKPKDNIPISDYIDEELRLLYVAYSRAKEKLIVYQKNREKSIKSHQIHLAIDLKRIYPIKSGIDKFTIFTVVDDEIQEVFNNVLIGSEVFLYRSKSHKWQVIINDKRIGTLSNNKLRERKELNNVNKNRLKGYYLSGFIKYTYQEVLEYDKEYQTDFKKYWTKKEAKKCFKRGWILIPDFAGYGIPY